MVHTHSQHILTAAALAVFVATTGAIQAPQTAQPPKPPEASGTTIAFTGGRMLDGTDKPPVENATIVVRGGKIVAAGPAASVTVPAGATRIDVTGKTVMPGLVNAHGHIGNTMGLESDAKFHTMENLQRQLALYARYGVTTVFSLGGDSEYGFKLREQSNDPALHAGADRAGRSGRADVAIRRQRG